VVGKSITVGDALQKLGNYFIENALVVANDNKLVLTVAIQDFGAIRLQLLAQQGVFEPNFVPQNLDGGPNPRHWQANPAERFNDEAFSQSIERHCITASRRYPRQYGPTPPPLASSALLEAVSVRPSRKRSRWRLNDVRRLILRVDRRNVRPIPNKCLHANSLAAERIHAVNNFVLTALSLWRSTVL